MDDCCNRRTRRFSRPSIRPKRNTQSGTSWHSQPQVFRIFASHLTRKYHKFVFGEFAITAGNDPNDHVFSKRRTFLKLEWATQIGCPFRPPKASIARSTAQGRVPPGTKRQCPHPAALLRDLHAARPMHINPPLFAACTPDDESSITMHSSTDNPRPSDAAKKISGLGFPFLTSSPPTTTENA